MDEVAIAKLLQFAMHVYQLKRLMPHMYIRPYTAAPFAPHPFQPFLALFSRCLF